MNTKNTLLSLIVALTLFACTGGDTSADVADDVGEGDVSFPGDLQVPEINFTPVVIESMSPPAFTLYGDSAVLERGSTWDETYVMPGEIVFHDGLLHMFYDGHMGVEGQSPTETVGYAVSADGYIWQRVMDDPVQFSGEPDYSMEGLLLASVLVEPDGTWVMYFTALLEGSLIRSGIGRATAIDPAGPWTIDKSLVLVTDSPERWDGNGIFSRTVIRTETGYVMYYSGVDVHPRTPVNQIGMATSPDGISWTKHDDPVTTDRLYAESDPVFGVGRKGSWDESGVYYPQVLRTEENWVMLYIGSQNEGFQRTTNVGFATSSDGIIWERYSGNPVFFPKEVMPDFHFGLMLWNYHDDTHFLYFGAYHESLMIEEIYLATSD